MKLKQALKITKKVLNDHNNKPDPIGVEIFHLKSDGTMSKSDEDRLKSNTGGFNVLDAYTDKTVL